MQPFSQTSTVEVRHTEPVVACRSRNLKIEKEYALSPVQSAKQLPRSILAGLRLTAWSLLVF